MADKRIIVHQGVDAEQVPGFEAEVKLDDKTPSNPCGHTHKSRREARLCGGRLLTRLLNATGK